MPNNNELPFGPLNGVVTPPRKASLNNKNVRVRGLTQNNEKVIETYTNKFLNLGLSPIQAKKAARNQFNLNKRNKRKTRKQRRQTN